MDFAIGPGADSSTISRVTTVTTSRMRRIMMMDRMRRGTGTMSTTTMDTSFLHEFADTNLIAILMN